MKNTGKKEILITAGPVWVPIDKVRVITNIFGGRLGYAIATEAINRGYRVTILLGPTRISYESLRSRSKVIQFHYYSELKTQLFKLLKTQKYSAVIHSAAVSDYQPFPVAIGKIKSGKNRLIIRLKPTLKLVDSIKKLSPNTYLVKFKLEVDKSKKELLKIAKNSLIASSADLIVANEFSTINEKHEAFIMDAKGRYLSITGKQKIAKNIMDIIDSKII